MPEINPYESPQSDHLPSTVEQQADEQFPSWLGRALWLQLLLILVTLFSPFGWFPKFIQLAIFVLHEIVASALFVAAYRYRFGWLAILEMIVIGMPLVALFQL